MSAEFTERYKHKIKTAAEIAEVVGAFPRSKKVIMCHGVFDVVHPGHLRHLVFAKSKADVLVASLTADRHIAKESTGRMFRILSLGRSFSRYAPVLDLRLSYCGEGVVRAVEKVFGRIGYPNTIRVDKGFKLVSRDLDLWAYANDVRLYFCRPAKPMDNAFIEAVNGRLRTE